MYDLCRSLPTRWKGWRVQVSPFLFWASLDHHITPELRRAVTGALDVANKTYVNVEFSHADHGFFCDERAAYNPKAAA
jgi:carboxymethylenebutenolidase